MALDSASALLAAVLAVAQDLPYRGRTLLHLQGTAEDVNAGLGAEVCALDDVDGDGTRDLALARSRDGNITGGNPAVVAVSGATGELLWRVEAGPFDDLMGASMSLVGDLDGDCISDLLVGTPTKMGSFGGDNFAWAVSGRDGQRCLAIRGKPTDLMNELFGTATADAGDLDGDGIGDFWVGAEGRFSLLLGLGSALAFSGSTGKELRRFEAPEGREAGGLLASLGDVNDDGVRDVASAGSWGTAWLYVLSGTDGTSIHEMSLAVGAVNALANVGDLDTDGVDDLAVGASVASAGTVLLIGGATGTELGRLGGPEPEANFGSALARLPDLDGDGLAELAVGMPSYGLGLGRVEILSPLSRKVLFFQNGLRAGGAFGSALDAADLDGNGTVELIVGQPGETRWMVTALGATASWEGWHGAVHVISIEPNRR